MRKLLLTTVLALVALLAPLTPAHAVGEWQDGTSDSDTIWDCLLNRPNRGTYAQAGWWSPTGQVPKVGETFYVRGYIGLVGQPCSDAAKVYANIVLPAGVGFAKGEYRWALQAAGQPQDMRERPFTYDDLPEGIVIGDADGQPFAVRKGGVFEFQFPVTATRPLIGPGTRAPECQQRRDGNGPCPVAESGDHLQVAFTVFGHGGDKRQVTPYVPLFAAAVPTVPGPGTPPTAGPSPVVPAGPAAKAVSRTTATLVKARRPAVRVGVDGAATGTVELFDRGRRIATSTLNGGTARVALPRLRPGRHVLVARYLGSETVAASASAPLKVRVVRR
jgi:hypothetical protein